MSITFQVMREIMKEQGQSTSTFTQSTSGHVVVEDSSGDTETLTGADLPHQRSSDEEPFIPVRI